MIYFVVDFVSGLVFGLEHLKGVPEEDDFHWAICLHLGIVRFSVVNGTEDF